MKTGIQNFMILAMMSIGTCAISADLTPSGVIQPSTPAVPYGSRIQRTMRLLATSTPEHKNKVRILIYGQSISCGPWCDAVVKKLKTDFPNADLELENRQIGGFNANGLIDTAEADLYPFYPDLVIFHVYGGTDDGAAGKMCTLEKLYRNLRSRTTAEMLTITHHIVGSDDAGRDKWLKVHDNDSEVIRQLADKYGYEVADIRPDWKKHVDDNGGKQTTFLADGTHLNPKGHELMASLVIPHLKFNPEQKQSWREMVKAYTADGKRWDSDKEELPSKGDLLSKPVKFQFDGNRVDLIAMPIKDGKPGTAKILIDGKAPSTIPGVYATTRASQAPKCWWPALRRVEIGSDSVPVAEDWTLTFTKVNEKATEFEYELKGSVTGPDGNGDSKGKFTSKSGRMIIDPKWFTITSAFINFKEAPKSGFEVKWSVVAKCADTWRPNPTPDPAKEDRAILAQALTNSSHTLEIIPNGDGSLGLRAIVVYQPPVKE
ncbi:MAG: SGNH/GDSL hydrolase family protein [Victivallales bacterium]|jgi:lysophospholipase L1-like esterase